MKTQFTKVFALAFFIFCFGAGINLQAQNRAYRATDSQVQYLLNRIVTRTDAFKRETSRAIDASRLNNTDAEENFNNYVSDFENATDALKQKFASHDSVDADVEDVLSRAADINQFLQSNRLNANVQSNWNYIQTDLNTLARYYGVSWNWNNPTTGVGNSNSTGSGSSSSSSVYRASDRDLQTLLSRLETRTDAYKSEINAALGRSVLNNTRSQEAIFSNITEFENATDRLKQNFNARRSTAADVEEVLNRAYYIDSFMRDYRFAPNAESQWRLIRTDLDTLSGYYNVAWNWNRQFSPASRFDSMLTGTYRLNVAQSDNVSEVVGRAVTAYYPGARGERSRANLERRLTSPDTLVIEKRDKQVTIASSKSPQVSFNADGTARTETTANGRTIKVTANTSYDGVALSYEGDRVNDFYVNFIPTSSGQLRVVRRVNLENRSDTVTVASVYDKTDTAARFSNIDNNQNNGQNTGDFVVPNSTRLTTVLRTAISTKASQNGDRFTMEVTSPNEYNGAIIEGRVTGAQRSGQVSGRANLSLEFDTIRLRNGSTYRFGGIVEQVTLANGEKVTVNNEGTVRDNNQTTKTVTRAGIGAALGAIIGAIAGGGQGAAIGAAVGAGAGAGTVILQGRDDVELAQGTEVVITSSAPNNLNNNR